MESERAPVQMQVTARVAEAGRTTVVRTRVPAGPANGSAAGRELQPAEEPAVSRDGIPDASAVQAEWRRHMARVAIRAAVPPDYEHRPSPVAIAGGGARAE